MERMSYSIKIVILILVIGLDKRRERGRGVTRELLILINENAWHLLWLTGGYDLILFFFYIVFGYLKKIGERENEMIGGSLLFWETFCRESKKEERKSEKFLTFERRFEGVWIIKKNNQRAPLCS